MGRGKRTMRRQPPVRVIRGAVASLAVMGLAAGSVVAIQAPKAELTAEPAVANVDVAERRAQQASRNAIRAQDTLGEAGRFAAAAELDKADEREAAKTKKVARIKGLRAEKPAKVKGSVYTTKAMNLRSGPTTDSSITVTVPVGTKLQATTKTKGAWQQLRYSGKVAWVYDNGISSSKPSSSKSSSSKSSAAKSGGSKSSRGGSSSRSAKRKSSGSTPSGVSGSACSSSGVESGLQPNTVAVHRAICNTFPSIKSYGGTRGGGGNHGAGRALDAMIPNWSGGGNATGWQVARYVRANAGRLGVTEVIFDQKIWTTQRSGEGWRSMSSRGSATANHQDHVHVSVR